ncbi:MAG: UDP-N-acetylmuramoyl-L-alanine--D-glutamate ligase [Pseudomonadota bacterium]
MIPVTCFAGKKVALFGLGGSGLSTAKALREGAATVIAWDDHDHARQQARSAGIDVRNLHQASLKGFDALVLSPGVPLTHPEPHAVVKLAHEAQISIIGDIELFFLERARAAFDGPVVAITGTNGKSTTTALIAHALNELGVDVAMGGNIGVPALELPPFTPGRHYVLECSSYQIDLAPSIAPTIGVHLNLAEDHLARHGSMQNYATIKERLVASAETAVIGVDDAFSRAIADRRRTSRASFCLISASEQVSQGVFSRNGDVFFATEDGVRKLFDLKGAESLRGWHNAQNVCAAVASLIALDIDAEKIGAAIRSFPGLSHRMEFVGEIENVRVINDSKATNADAAAHALASFSNIYWIVGGEPKSDGIEPLNEFFPQIVKAYLVGEAQDRFAQTLGGKVSHVKCETVEAATKLALSDAITDRRVDATVLLSPACASFDQFKSFEARGDAFKRAVSRILKEASAGG